MTPTKRSIPLIALIMLLIILLPALTGLVGSALDNNPDNDDFSVISNFVLLWAGTLIQKLPLGLTLGISIFALFVVYLGGRSNHRRFNDRTIASHSFSKDISLTVKTALLRAAFNFSFFENHLDHINNQLNNGFMPILISISRRY